jgi:hypothetical protein
VSLLSKAAKILARTVFWTEIARINTIKWVKVISYDSDENTVTVQPVVQRFRSNDPDNMTTINLVELTDVPVQQPGSGKSFLTSAPEPGSYGWCGFSDRCIEQWKNNGGVGVARSARMFDFFLKLHFSRGGRRRQRQN